MREQNGAAEARAACSYARAAARASRVPPRQREAGLALVLAGLSLLGEGASTERAMDARRALAGAPPAEYGHSWEYRRTAALLVHGARAVIRGASLDVVGPRVRAVLAIVDERLARPASDTETFAPADYAVLEILQGVAVTGAVAGLVLETGALAAASAAPPSRERLQSIVTKALRRGEKRLAAGGK